MRAQLSGVEGDDVHRATSTGSFFMSIAVTEASGRRAHSRGLVEQGVPTASTDATFRSTTSSVVDDKLGTAAATAAVDEEQLLWRRGSLAGAEPAGSLPNTDVEQMSMDGFDGGSCSLVRLSSSHS